MSTIEEKLLDGPRIHYCEAGDDDVRPREDVDDAQDSSQKNDARSLFTRPPTDEEERLEQLDHVRWRSSGSTNTGPKGVIEDYKKRSLSSKETQKKNEVEELEAEFQELLNDDSILKEYISKRISQSIQTSTPTFGQIYHLQTGTQLLDAIDKENPNVLVIVHIYTRYSRSCSNLNKCLEELANELKHIKFVTLDASVTALSGNFKENGVPALLAYRKGDLVKSLVQLEELLDKNFDSVQVKELLLENGLVG